MTRAKEPMRFADEADCLTDVCRQRLSKAKTYPKVITGLTGPRVRMLCRCRVGEVEYWADPITGTLYDPVTGRGLSGGARMLVRS